ncbi:unnamed protein product [Allacma fusca]|uniref:Uncharacterized protein n=1 Tax=Allacma fusca TaxID=39272 RepID=A0A8J2NFY2_9HEXA|nr:unnamed protein product [Allacma fusca]
MPFTFQVQSVFLFRRVTTRLTQSLGFIHDNIWNPILHAGVESVIGHSVHLSRSQCQGKYQLNASSLGDKRDSSCSPETV